MFSHCSIDVKIVLFNSYYTPLHCSYLWTDYNKTSFNKIRVAFNNAYRLLISQIEAMQVQCMQNIIYVILRKTFIISYNDYRNYSCISRIHV